MYRTIWTDADRSCRKLSNQWWATIRMNSQGRSQGHVATFVHICLLLTSGHAAGAQNLRATCQCNASPNTVAAAGRSDYGTFCASWDAPDEKPWCRVASATACGLDTFSSTAGIFWSHAPCKGKPAGAPPPPSVTASKGSAASAHAQAPEKCVGDAMACRRKVALRGCGALCSRAAVDPAPPDGRAAAAAAISAPSRAAAASASAHLP